MRVIKKVLAGAAMATAFIAVSAPAAMADPMSVQLPYEGHGGVHTGHTYVYACDDNADGDGVRMWYWLRSGGTGQVGDGNGSRSGCGGRSVTTTANPVVKVQLCAGPSGKDLWCTRTYAA